MGAAQIDLANGNVINLAPNGSQVLIPIGQRGAAGADGSNVLPTDTAMANGVNNTGGVYPLFSAALAASYARPTSTDGTGGLAAPTGVGLELVITAAGLDDIRYGGVSL